MDDELPRAEPRGRPGFAERGAEHDREREQQNPRKGGCNSGEPGAFATIGVRGNARLGACQQTGGRGETGERAQARGELGEVFEFIKAPGALRNVLAEAALLFGIEQAGSAQGQQRTNRVRGSVSRIPS